MTDVHTRRLIEQRNCKNADQAEYASVLFRSAVLDAGTYDDRVAGAMDDYDPQDPSVQGWHQHDVQEDNAVGAALEEVQRRADMMGAAYPFRLEGGQILHTGSKTGFYEFCLAVALAPTITAGEYVHLPRMFERASALLVKEYFGCHAEAMHTGSPRDPGAGTKFKEAMGKLHAASMEWCWGPEHGLPEDPPALKDEGMDFVVWKRSLDARPGQLFVLGQCACGDDWNTKFSDLNLATLRRWFRPMTWLDPVRAFTTPHHLSNGYLNEATKEAGLIFDRARLSIIAEGSPADAEFAGLGPRLAELTGMVIQPIGTRRRAAA